jgi:hypothetical protein
MPSWGPAVSRSSVVVASAPRGSRFGLWLHRLTLLVFAGVLLLLVGEAVGLIASDIVYDAPGGRVLALAALVWVLFWVGLVFTLRLELTRNGRLHWFGALRQGSVDIVNVERISTDAAPFFWVIHHAHGRLIVAFVTEMKGFLRALDELSTAGDNSTSSGYQDIEADS